jgi:trehalose 6-phosphate synthase/phosphatase
MKYDARHWARTFIDQLCNAREERAGQNAVQIEELTQLLRVAVTAQKRIALFLDYDGTLREIERDPGAAKPNDSVRQLLKALRNRANLIVTLVSGRSREELEKWFGRYPFAIIAEHGAALWHAGRWERLDTGLSYGWKDQILNILRRYEQSTPGSFVEEKETSLVWHYRNTDPEFGAWKAHQLAVELGAVMESESVAIRHGRKIIEASGATISKGEAVRRLLGEQAHDLALCAGDDQTDESMFELSGPNLITIKIGPKPSRAHYRVVNPAAFRRFLHDALAL